MENDKFQIIIDHLVRVTQEITEIKAGQQQFSDELSGVKSNQKHFSGDIAEIKANQHHFSNELSEIKTNQRGFSERLAQIENEHGQKLNALFDAWQTQQEVNDRVLVTLSRMEEKIDNLSIKVAKHDLMLQKGYKEC